VFLFLFLLWSEVRRRARGMVVACLVADAAAMGVHWVYDPEVLAGLGKGRGGLEFMDPPQSPFFTYPPGEAMMTS
jgi:hypothetical protein